MTPSRRSFLASLPPAAASLGPSAVAAQQGSGQDVSWRMATSFPPSSDVLHGAALRVGERVSVLTGGRFTIRAYAAGELVPAFQVMDAVEQGTVQCGLSPGYFYVGKHPALAFDTTVPFGLTTRQQLGWLYGAGGLDLVNSVYADFGIVMVPTIASPGQMGGWFRRPIASLQDLVGLRFRIPGFGGEIMARLGVTVQVLAPAEIYPALERGAIDATEWVGPHDDEKMGLYRIAKNYYYPGWWEPGTTMGLLVSRAAYDALPDAYRHALHAACGDTLADTLARYQVEDPRALTRLVEDQGVVLRQYPDDVLDAAWRESNAFLEEQAAGDARFRAVYEPWKEFRRLAFMYGRTTELAYLRDVMGRTA